MVKNIVFDIGNIIYKGYPKDCLNNLNIYLSSKKLYKETIFNNPKFKDLDTGKYTLEEYYNEIKEDIPKEMQTEAKNITLNYYKWRDINNGIVELIKDLKNNGYNIYILSDNTVEACEYIKTLEFSKYIDEYCVSAAFHATKSDKNLYDVFIKEYNLIPSECYFIDDKKENIENATLYGMTGFVLDWQNNTFTDLQKDLLKNKINF